MNSASNSVATKASPSLVPNGAKNATVAIRFLILPNQLLVSLEIVIWLVQVMPMNFAVAHPDSVSTKSAQVVLVQTPQALVALTPL